MDFDIKLSKNFRLSEFLYSEVAEENNIYQQYVVPYSVVMNLKDLCVNLLQPIRDICQYPISINSGYRCKELNRVVGGASTSQHLVGCAADITSLLNYDLFHIIKDYGKFDQLIVYGDSLHPRFLHVSFSASPRKQIIYRP